MRKLHVQEEGRVGEAQSRSFQVVHVAARELPNPESNGPVCWSENRKCWLSVDQNYALVAKNKAHSSQSHFKPLLGFLQLWGCASAWIKSETKEAMLDGHWPLSNTLIPRLRSQQTSCKHSAFHSWGHTHHQVEMPQMYFLTQRKQAGRLGGRRSRRGWRGGCLMNVLTAI